MMDTKQTIEGVSVKKQSALGNEEIVREYGADGTLYVYHNNDGEHVVVSQGWENADQWVKTVTADRTIAEIEVGDCLWVVPDNWESIVNVGGKTICEVDGGYVEIERPKNTQLRDADIRVTDIGDDLVTEYHTRDWDWTDVHQTIEEFEDDDTGYGQLVYNTYTQVQECTGEIEEEVAEMASEPWVMDYVLGGTFVASYDSHRISLSHAEIDGRGLIGDVVGLDADEKEILSDVLVRKVTSPTVVLNME